MLNPSARLRAFAANAALSCAPAAQAQTRFQFAVIGDTPHFPIEERQVAATLEALAREPVAFVPDVGGIQGGGTPCSDQTFAARRALLDASPLPLVLTPGDNQWTDCHRRRPGGHATLKRLARLRGTLFAGSQSLGRSRLALARRPGRPANARWPHEGILFVTLDIPGRRATPACRPNATRAWPTTCADWRRRRGVRRSRRCMRWSRSPTRSPRRTGAPDRASRTPASAPRSRATQCASPSRCCSSMATTTVTRSTARGAMRVPDGASPTCSACALRLALDGTGHRGRRRRGQAGIRCPVRPAPVGAAAQSPVRAAM